MILPQNAKMSSCYGIGMLTRDYPCYPMIAGSIHKRNIRGQQRPHGASHGLYYGLNDSTKIPVQFYRRLLHVSPDPPEHHFYKAA